MTGSYYINANLRSKFALYWWKNNFFRLWNFGCL